MMHEQDGTRAFCPPFVPMHDLIEPTESGSVRLDAFSITPEEARTYNLRSYFHARGDTVRPGRYARLTRNGTLWMTDTPYERRGNLELHRAAKGDVLILGLGIGMLPTALAQKPDVTSITIVEIDEDVIAAVTPTLTRTAPAARVLHGDAFLPERLDLPRARAGGGFDTILADVWPTICADDRPQHIAMRRAWRAWLRPSGRHVTWQEDRVKREWDADRRDDSRTWWRREPVEREPTANARATAFLARLRSQ
jgi:hypothetical protein